MISSHRISNFFKNYDEEIISRYTAGSCDGIHYTIESNYECDHTIIIAKIIL
ncbi:MAG: hypothetical protein LBD32_00365 [Cytophagales bacterium]|nr:hypothetical protein [Cytophagales bacterium]